MLQALGILLLIISFIISAQMKRSKRKIRREYEGGLSITIHLHRLFRSLHSNKTVLFL
jgi:hypothetical protein